MSTSSSGKSKNFIMISHILIFIICLGEKPLAYEVASCQPGWEGVCSTALMLKGQGDKFGLHLKLDCYNVIL